MPLQKLTDVSSDAAGSTDALDLRVRRLEQIVAASSASRAGAPAATDSNTADRIAVHHLAALSPRLQQLTREVESRLDSDAWDGADQLAARLLLDDLASALRSCRVISSTASAQLHDVEGAVNDTRHFLAREAARAAE